MEENNQTVLLETRLGIRFKLASRDYSASDSHVVERMLSMWSAGERKLPDTLPVPHVRLTGDQGDTEAVEERNLIMTLWFEREGQDIEKDERALLQTLCEKAMQSVADEHRVRCTPLYAKYVRKVEDLTFENLSTY
jgi:hypothetical protein